MYLVHFRHNTIQLLIDFQFEVHWWITVVILNTNLLTQLSSSLTLIFHLIIGKQLHSGENLGPLLNVLDTDGAKSGAGEAAEVLQRCDAMRCQGLVQVLEERNSEKVNLNKAHRTAEGGEGSDEASLDGESPPSLKTGFARPPSQKIGK